MATTVLHLRELRAALARVGLPQWRLAAALGISPSTLSAIIHGNAPFPSDLPKRIAQVLGVEETTLIREHIST